MRITRERLIAAPPEAIWPLVSEASGLEQWYHPADRVEDIGAGMIRIFARIGNVDTESDLREAAREHWRRIEWDIVGGRAKGIETRQSTKVNKYSIELDPGPQGTVVRLESYSEPASFGWRIMARVVRTIILVTTGKPMLKTLLERSLQSLAAAVAPAEAS